MVRSPPLPPLRSPESSEGVRHEGDAILVGVEQLLISPLQNVCLLHEGYAARSGVQRILNDLPVRLCQLGH